MTNEKRNYFSYYFYLSCFGQYQIYLCFPYMETQNGRDFVLQCYLESQILVFVQRILYERGLVRDCPFILMLLILIMTVILLTFLFILLLRYKCIVSTILSISHYYINILQYNLSQQIKSCNIFQQMSKEEQIRKENKKLREIVEGYLEEIEKFKKINEQHQTQIQTLLKFNERLLIIIETQLNTYNNRKSQRSLSLQPISQITQKDSQAVDVMGSIKASLINTYKMNQLDIPQRSKNIHDKKDGHQTERVILGDHLEDALSYEISRSDYQKQYSQYSKNEKVKQVMALINAYKQEYGESIKECEDIKLKLKEDALKDNMEMKNLNEENQNFYGSKQVELTNLKQKIKQSTPQKELQKILNSKKYSSGTQTKLMKIMNKIN